MNVRADHKEGWVPKNWHFKTEVWRRLLRIPWTARRSNQSILKEIYPEYSLKGLMLKLKLQYFGHLMIRADSLEKILMLGHQEKGTTEDEMAGWHHRLNRDELEQALEDGEGQGSVVLSMGSQRVGHDWAIEQISLSVFKQKYTLEDLYFIIYTPNSM